MSEETIEEIAPVPADHDQLIAEFSRALGDDLLSIQSNQGDVVARVRPEAWVKAAQVARDELDLEYLSFISVVDWMPAPIPPGTSDSDTSTPTQPSEMTYGVGGGETRFQIFASLQTTMPGRPSSLIVKADLDSEHPLIATWSALYPGADWHEREAMDMYGVTFADHPNPRKIYLPAEFEGHPLRKDFPLLAREVKPWPGLVDVEPMPGAGADD
ncbi:MAG: NADH-quinone oxidoreductase subunit C [Actinobacteria bacterium]|nr:NADH-quinone oxidoreductase subunit C [Actinomycetota bacterium]MCB9390474.1 NADH-quinone oxidoreductase subunit C [Acidimicrobiia bacterium]